MRLTATPFLVVITFCVIGCAANAVTVSGEVYDARNGLPLEGVRLTCYDSAAVSGEDGSFVLDEILPGERLFRAIYEGYAVYEDSGLSIPDIEELWINIPMLPLDRETPGENEDFLKFFRREAKVIERDRDRWYELPIVIGYRDGELPRAEFEKTVETLDEDIGGGVFESGIADTADIVFISGGIENRRINETAGTLLLSGDNEEQKKQLRAGLLLAVLNGRSIPIELDIESRWKQVGEEITDFVSATRLIYLLGPDFDYDRYRYNVKDGNGILFSFAGGPGKYTKTGWANREDEDYYYPYNPGMMGFDAGVGIRLNDFIGSIGYLGISTIGTGSGEEYDGLTIKEHTHSFNVYGGVIGYELPVKYGYLTLRPIIGWQNITIKGKYEAEDPGDSAIVRKVEKREELSGPCGGLKLSLFTPWAKMGGYVEYKYIRADDYVHYIDIGIGQAQWRGFGINLTWRQYWNDSLNYGIMGMGMNGEIELFN